MTDKQFLKNFKKHCEIARGLGIYSQVAMIGSLRAGRCPFTQGNFIDRIDVRKADKKRDKLFDLFSYWPTAGQYERSDFKAVSKMLSILKSIPWRI